MISTSLPSGSFTVRHLSSVLLSCPKTSVEASVALLDMASNSSSRAERMWALERSKSSK